MIEVPCVLSAIDTDSQTHLVSNINMDLFIHVRIYQQNLKFTICSCALYLVLLKWLKTCMCIYIKYKPQMLSVLMILFSCSAPSVHSTVSWYFLASWEDPLVFLWGLLILRYTCNIWLFACGILLAFLNTSNVIMFYVLSFGYVCNPSKLNSTRLFLFFFVFRLEWIHYLSLMQNDTLVALQHNKSL